MGTTRDVTDVTRGREQRVATVDVVDDDEQGQNAMDGHGAEDVDFDPQASLSFRLQSLFTSSPTSPSSPDLPHSDAPQQPGGHTRSADSDMRGPRTRTPSPMYNGRASTPPAHHTRSSTPKSLSLSLPQPSSSHMPQRDKPYPVLRWLTGKQHSRSSSKSLAPTRSSLPSPSRSSASTPSPSPTASTPTTPSSAASALADALHDDPLLSHSHHDSTHLDPDSSLITLPVRPQAARLPQHFNPSRPPRYLSDLTRSTLPTACLSPPLPSNYQNSASYTDPWAAEHEYNPDLDLLYSPTPTPVAIPHTPAPAHLNRSHNRSSSSNSLSPSRSSLDTLRSIHERGRSIHTTAPQSLKLPSLPLSIRSWFGSEEGVNKENIHPLLGEEDKQESAQAERDHIRKKCASLPSIAFVRCKGMAVLTLLNIDYAPRNPVVFCHGLLGFDTVTIGPSIAPMQVTHWRGIKEALEANGIEVRLVLSARL